MRQHSMRHIWRRWILPWGSTVLFGLMLTGCYRGEPKTKPPIHIVPDMDVQPKYLPEAESKFFKNHMTMRQPVYGTVARGELRNNDSLYAGKDIHGKFLQHNPLVVNMDLLEHGEKEYNIFCSPCHSKVGDGRGILVQYNYVPPANFHDERLRTMPDGEIFNTITHGKRNMPSYASQIPVKDRWAIIAYVRALQRSWNASLSDVPKEKRDQLK